MTIQYSSTLWMCWGVTHRSDAVWGTGVFAGSERRDAAERVITASAGTHHLPRWNRTCKQTNLELEPLTYQHLLIQVNVWSPLLREDGLWVRRSCSGMPTGFCASLSTTCFLFLPRLFNWWAVRARATLPSAVANRIFFRLGLNFSWENIDWDMTDREIKELNYISVEKKNKERRKRWRNWLLFSFDWTYNKTDIFRMYCMWEKWILCSSINILMINNDFNFLYYILFSG